MKLLLIALILITSCSARLSVEGRRVRQAVSFTDVKECTLIKEVKGSDRKNGGIFGQGKARRNAIRQIKNKSARLGANTFLIVDENTGLFGASIIADSFSAEYN